MELIDSIVRVAAVQAEPEWLDLQGSVAKACSLIEDAAKGGAKLVAFPETFIPGYPGWIWTRPVDPELTKEYIRNSLRIDSPEMGTIRAAASSNNIDVVLGFSENDGHSLYLSQALISGENGEILMKRRKIKPTHCERTIFGEGSGESLVNVVERPIGNVGALNCWEHVLPLLKYHTFVQHEQIHVGGWPPLDPFVDGSPGHWGMTREGSHAAGQMYALEGGCFVLHTTAVLSQKGIDKMRTQGGVIFHSPGGGCTAIYGPDGRRLTAPMAEHDEGLVFADLDMSLLLSARMLMHTVGHYSRPDLLWLGADTRERVQVEYPHGSSSTTKTTAAPTSPAGKKQQATSVAKTP
jgi:nitrilase